MRVWECNGKNGLEDYQKETKSCSRMMPQCKASFHFLFKRPNHLNTQKLLFSWGPGSVGEQMAEGTGIKMDRGHYLMLQVGIWNLQQSSIRWNTTRAPVSSPMIVDSSYNTIEDTTWDQWAGFTSPHLTNSHNPTLVPLSAPPLVFPHRYEA